MKRLLLPLLLLAAIAAASCSKMVGPPNATGAIVESGGTYMTMGAVADGECLSRSGTTVDGVPCRVKVDVQTLGADATSITFSSLSGSYIYTVHCNATLAASGAATIALNSGLTTYYNSYFLRDSTSFAGGDLSAAPWYFLHQNWGASDVSNSTAIIRAATGRQRSYHGEAFAFKADRSVSRQIVYDGLLSDTSTAVTSIVITSGTASGILAGSTCTLWKEAL